MCVSPLHYLYAPYSYYSLAPHNNIVAELLKRAIENKARPDLFSRVYLPRSISYLSRRYIDMISKIDIHSGSLPPPMVRTEGEVCRCSSSVIIANMQTGGSALTKQPASFLSLNLEMLQVAAGGVD